MNCPDCGALYTAATDNCQTRFDALLALDHSRQEPWGSRHGLAFSAFALQHPSRYDRSVLDRAWTFLHAVYVRGHALEAVTRALLSAGRRPVDWDVPKLPPAPSARAFETTIADLDGFDAERYPDLLDQWCLATLSGWRAVA